MRFRNYGTRAWEITATIPVTKGFSLPLAIVFRHFIFKAPVFINIHVYSECTTYKLSYFYLLNMLMNRSVSNSWSNVGFTAPKNVPIKSLHATPQP